MNLPPGFDVFSRTDSTTEPSGVAESVGVGGGRSESVGVGSG